MLENKTALMLCSVTSQEVQMVAGNEIVATKEMIVDRYIARKESIKPDETLVRTRRR